MLNNQSCNEGLLQDMLLLDHLGDVGMSEMISLMRLHVQEVTRFSLLVAYRLPLSAEQQRVFVRDCSGYEIDPEPFLQTVEGGTRLSIAGIQLLKICAKVHDIGKPFFRQIYSQARRLTQQEFNQQKLHANLSRLIVKGWLNQPGLHFSNPDLVRMVADVAAQHQEKFDGTGYPDGIAGEEISLLGRLLAITDAISAIVNPRPYEAATPLQEALVRLESDSGRHFDPLLLEQAITVLRQEVTDAPRFSVEWDDRSEHSPDYLQFVANIDYAEVVSSRGEVGRGDRQTLQQLQQLTQEVLERPIRKN